jgi:hypothetical protein
MNQEQDKHESEKPVDETTTQSESTPGDGEFKLTVRKLEMPVRPRGVLAE